MTASNVPIHARPLASVPASANSLSIPLTTDTNGNSLRPDRTMPYTCQSCAKRKVKCDKVAPKCSTCRKGELDCYYQAPPPRRRKRKLSGGDIHEKLARYKRILHQNGLLPSEVDVPPPTGEAPPKSLSRPEKEPESPKTGRLLASEGKSRYIDSNVFQNLGDEEMQHMSDDEEDDFLGRSLASDPLTGAFIDTQQTLFHHHPTHTEAMILWNTHVEAVEPICKILHIPSTFKMVEMVSQQPAMASKSEECLLFVIYHFAVFSMTQEECVEKFGQSRDDLMRLYHFASRQALVNASFLKTTEISILQSLVLFLLPCRYFYDVHSYWILTGVAMRIAQRMGLHRDGANLGLPPFEVQMRRRLFYQILPLDGIASQISGTGMAISVESWDTQQPLNVNDDQIWPGMTELPEQQKGATEMIFCLTRSCVGQYFAKAGRPMHGAGSGQFKDYQKVERLICEAENEVEEKYIRYCDMVNPLHFLAIVLARSAITAMRIRIRLPKVRDKTVTDTERKELFQLTLKIIDTDTAALTHHSLRKYLWHIRSFFVWGSWDSLIFVLTTLQRDDLLSSTETDAAWTRIEQIYNNRSELLELKQALHIAIRRLTLKAWDTNPPSVNEPDPTFITSLRSLQSRKLQSKAEENDSNLFTLDAETKQTSQTEPAPANDKSSLMDSLPENMGLDISNDFSLDTADWVFWDQLIHDYQAQGG